MNSRLPFDMFADRIRAALGPLALRVGHVMEPDFIQAYQEVRPAVWVGAQRSSVVSVGHYSGQWRQTDKVEVLVRCCVNRFEDGDIDADSRMTILVDGTTLALRGWQPSGADDLLVLESSQDGSPVDAIMAVDLVFSTTVTYSGAAP